MRLFVMIDVPDAWRSAARAAQRALIERVPPETLRPVARAQLHLTLRFLGEVDEGSVPALRHHLSSVAPVDLTLELGRAGSFGGPRRTRVAWLAVESANGGLDALAERIEGAVVSAGAPPRRERFHAHLTLARVARRVQGPASRAVGEAVAALPRAEAPPFRAREFALVRSHLGSAGGHGPRYETIAPFR
ncbi:MAG: RNA 2',3'-cyclic phosphodiesterase [Chloroflexi bacterium]|nr:RNA 2',3'-cyclic phosphodiesterase [Chloroflexota bacterium]